MINDIFTRTWHEIHMESIFIVLLLRICLKLHHVVASEHKPRHIGFIMDGNRTYAKAHNLSPSEGHSLGAATLQKILLYCACLGVKEVTVYAFSIENFRRPRGEIDAIFSYIIERPKAFYQSEYGKRLRLRIVGNRSYLPAEVLEKLEEMERISNLTEKEYTVNICIAYTARDEIAHAIKSISTQRKANSIKKEDISATLLEDNMYFGPDRKPLDILVRTSGHTRLSDFLLWQCTLGCHIAYLETLWPDFLFVHLLWIFLTWSHRRDRMAKRFDIAPRYERPPVDLARLPNCPPLVSVNK